MGEQQNNSENNEAAKEAAQGVVDDVTSWEYSADKDRIADELDSGLSEAGVEVGEGERDKLVDQIDDLKQGEDAGSPEVGEAKPKQ